MPLIVVSARKPLGPTIWVVDININKIKPTLNCSWILKGNNVILNDLFYRKIVKAIVCVSFVISPPMTDMETLFRVRILLCPYYVHLCYPSTANKTATIGS